MKTNSFTRLGSSSPFAFSTLLAVVFSAAVSLEAQSLITDSAFFDPDFEARRPGSGLVLSLQVNTNFYTPAAESSGNTTWEHSAAGLVQLGADASPLGMVDVQLAAYTRTTGNTLVFGRELEVNTSGTLALLGPTITSVTNQVLGVSALNAWSSTADVTGLSLTQGQNYLVSFNVQSGAGIDLDALSAANFSLLNGGNPIQDINTTQTANILNILQLGGGLGTIEFEFQASSAFTDLTFQFDAATVADANLLGGISGNQTVLEFSNFSLTPVPEPGSLFLASLGVLVILRRRRFMV